MTEITAIVGVLLAVSLAVERVLELLKKTIPYLRGPWEPKHDKRALGDDWREVWLLVLGTAAGAFVAWGAKAQIAAVLPLSLKDSVGPGIYIMIGFLTSGGSKFWNQILDILHAAKVQKEALARDMQKIQRTQPAGTLSKAVAAGLGK